MAAATTTTTTSSQPASGALAVASKQQHGQQQHGHHHVASKSLVRAAGGLWSRALSTPVSLALTAAAAATSVVARALAAAGCPPDGYVTSLKLREAMTVIDHMSFREEQYRLRLAALKEEADAAARDRRRTGAKLQRARAEVAELAAAANAAANAAAMASAAANRSGALSGGGGGGGMEGGGGAGGTGGGQHLRNQQTATTTQKTTSDLGDPRGRPSPLVHVASAAAAAAVLWFHRAGVDVFPPLAHKVVTAVAAPFALLWAGAAVGRPAAPHAVLLAVSFFLLGYCASHWVALGAV